MQFQENYSLKPHNSFGIDARARYFADFSSVEELEELVEYAYGRSSAAPDLILGGGSNILLSGDINGWVFHNKIRGIELVHEDAEGFLVSAGAGENWHQFVQFCISQGWAGLENLSLIPGSVGAAPMQNIGAYGAEIKDCFHSLLAWDTEDGDLEKFSREDCEFGYRESIFKNKVKGQFIILRVWFKLKRKPVFNTSYGAIQQELEKMGVKDLSIRAIADAVIRIRQSKLPDPNVIGNAGSFFKNPTIPREQYNQLIKQYPQLSAFTNADGSMKLAAGWLIEQCGWKGFRKGDAGCHAQQALVLVNYGNAKGKDILELSADIQQSVREKFGVELEREVNII